LSALDDRPQRDRLAGELKRLRLASGLRHKDLADALGVTQPTISRIESGRTRVSLPQVSLWLKVTSAPSDREAELLRLAGDILIGPVSWEDSDAQQELHELEIRTGTRSEFEPAVLPGLLQTAAYAARVISSGPAGTPPNLAERVMNRIKRQPILNDDGKLFRFVIPEAVLRWPFGPAGDPAVLREHQEQLAAILAATMRPNVEIGILPLAPSPAWRLEGFSIYDDVQDGEPLVHLEWLTRPYNITEPGQVEMCRQAFANLLSASARGDDAAGILRKVLTEA
jgi:transcriptional regulator with XRE-family HTH domain